MKRRSRTKPEPTIALINVVFLMLIFFLVAGTISQPLDTKVTLINTATLDPASPPDALIILPDGTLRYRGEEIGDVSDYLGQSDSDFVRIVPDRALSAQKLVEIGSQLQAAGASSIRIVTQRDM